MPAILPVPGPSEAGDDWSKHMQNILDTLKNIWESIAAFSPMIGAAILSLCQKGVEIFREIPWYFIAKFPANYVGTFMAPKLAGGLLIAFGLVPELLLIVVFLPLVLLTLIFYTILICVGFGSRGVRAGSMAARHQSVNYGGSIPRGSAFSQGQSMGAVGMGGLSCIHAVSWPLRIVTVVVGVLVIVSDVL
ncbi:hypothetical protein BD410DRAFT_788886 [Rickenella mellea]|uniref:Uncharacterized protein n=1 Tax=Rickenella mellea TaxID=50990 RepID=A0A4Y7Q461_9AGAM|nr:hypothetical protein BD410DRAFT_788886 [Rickenella mellea]